MSEHNTHTAEHKTAQQDKHPEEVIPLGEPHKTHLAPEEKRVVNTLILGIIATIIFIPIIAAISESPMLNVIIGLSPLLASLIIDLILAKQHYKVLTFWIVFVITHILGIAIIYGLNFVLIDKVNLSGSISTSATLTIIATAIVTLMDAKQIKSRTETRKEKVVEFKPEKITEYVHSIEDKAKAINFVIGRVYRASNGGTASMREKLKINPEWYNEFHQIKDEEVSVRLDRAKILVRKIRDRLSLFVEQEKSIFPTHEVKNIKNLVRDQKGEDKIIDILKMNDKDPIDHYYVSAVDFCDRILEELEKK